MSKEQHKSGKGVAILFLVFAWLIFILLALVFYFYYFDKLDFNAIFGKKETTETVDMAKPSYETNADVAINSLVVEYYTALAICDQAKLKTLVTDPSQFDDMSPYQRTANKITNYANVNCYTLPGYTEDGTVCYVICNLTIADVQSSPLNISRMYIVKDASGNYKIDNSSPSPELDAFLDTQDANPDIQDLYKKVRDDIDRCVASDEKFAAFYNEINAQPGN